LTVSRWLSVTPRRIYAHQHPTSAFAPAAVSALSLNPVMVNAMRNPAFAADFAC
jgi:hypothetical protein